ncbi:MAG: hypothetical protein ACJ786_23175 [Catenulispora sp.]
MLIVLVTRSAVLGTYLVALACHGLTDLASHLTAVAIVALWTGSLLRDRRRWSSTAVRSTPPTGTASG